MTETTRAEIRACIKDHPGLHFNALVRKLDFAPGQIQYHLRTLLDTDAVSREEYYGQTHYYPPEWDDWDKGVLALARRETARHIVFDLLEHGPSRPNEVANRIGVARSTLEWHLGHLVEQRVVRKERTPNNHVTLVLTNPEETIRLLDMIEPSLPERMVDRFERLLDQLFTDQ